MIFFGYTVWLLKMGLTNSFSWFQPSKIEVNIASKILLQRYIITFSSDSRIVKLRKF